MPSFSLTPLPPFPPPSGPFPSGTQFQDETVNVGPPTPRYVSFNGPGVQATYDGANGRVNVEVSTGAVEVLDEGVVVLPAVRRINFVGDGVTATAPSGSTDTVNVAVPGATGGGGGPVPLFRATRSTLQSSGSVVTYSAGMEFTYGFGTLNLTGGYFEVEVEGIYYFTATVPIQTGSAAEFGVAIASWPNTVSDPYDNQSQVVFYAYDTDVTQYESYYTIGINLHTGPVHILPGRRVGVVRAFYNNVGVWSSGAGSVSPTSPRSLAMFSGEYYPWVGV